MTTSMERKRVRRGESFGRCGVDRTISNSLKSPSRQKQKQHSVRFAEETPRIHTCSNFDPLMTPVEVDVRKKELWYSRNDFEEFLRDRISTIQLLKVVQGNTVALRNHCPDLCLRGLEPYQCDTLNQELQCQRQLHQRVVLTEQTLQKSQNQKADPESIRLLAQGRSEWARQRAQQLGSMDEFEVKTTTVDDSTLRRRSLASAQLGFENLRLTQRRRSSLSSTLGLTTPRRVPVDLAILKEWNAKFLQDIRQKNGTTASNASGTISIARNTQPKSLSDKTAESRRMLQRDSVLFRSAVGGTPLATTTPTSTVGYGNLLAGKKDLAPNAPSFRFPVRRDSLVGLRRESFLANKAAATETRTLNPRATAMSTLAAAAAAVSAAGTSSMTEACFRFPTRRDSLSNVHWN